MKNLLKEYHQAADREIQRWPGVAIIERRIGKHARLSLEFQGRRRFVIHPASPSDVRGVHRHVQDIKRVLTELGANRV
jgi:hypothetical protein